ncbi:arsenate reductase/protein-tyrosine-phosphatase family protein [Microbacterium wangchenii]|uniref:arsenate reductase/protein-tyrosine-phosphatase family protein n=1 Tax=Microbacterium wangchenii TaxID=2541726 RepID=UPI0011C79D9A|nr:low molecular weight phosphatase family protein [Microbacterium wangchenii]TXK16049.1 low molecular weight phosphatase family protein [Microbacterium wangchenii]
MLDLDLSGLFAPRGDQPSSPTIEILTVCTGNICRSPLAEQVLRTRLRPLDVRVASAGTHAMIDSPMTPEAARMAASLGVAADDSAAHRGRWLSERELASPDLVIAMTREHRRDVVELAPARMRSTFTVREFERLATGLPDAELRQAADAAGTDPHARVRAALALLTSRRGVAPAPAAASDDDVIDPYRRSWETYQRSTAQLLPGLTEVVRVLRAVLN